LIKVISTEASYRSQSNSLDRDELPKYGESKLIFKGKRIGIVDCIKQEKISY